MTNPAVKEWLNELKHAAYDADDLLDEVATAALKRESEIASNYFKGKAKAGPNEAVELSSTLNPFHDGVKDRLKNKVERLEFSKLERSPQSQGKCKRETTIQIADCFFAR